MDIYISMHRYNIKTLLLGSVLLVGLTVAVLLSTSSNASAQTLEANLYSPPTPSSLMTSIVAGPDGNMWVTKTMEDQVAKISLDGNFTEYALPSGTRPLSIAAGPDGNMWVTTDTGGKVLKISTSGDMLASYDVTAQIGGRVCWGIAAGPDGNMWINVGHTSSGIGNDKILKITMSGVATAYTISDGSLGIAAGPDGNMWFGIGGYANTTNYIGKITMSGTVTEYPLPGLGDGTTLVAAGPDGNMWYLRAPFENPKIGKITPEGVVTEYSLTAGAYSYYGMVVGVDGRIWVTETGLGKLAAIDMEGNITEYDLGDHIGALALTVGPDNNFWFTTQTQVGKVGDTPGGGNPTLPPTEPNSPTPTTPRTGKIIGAMIASSALIGLVITLGIEMKKMHNITDTSDK